MARPPVAEFMTSTTEMKKIIRYRDPLQKPEREVFVEIAGNPRITAKEVAERTGLNPDVVSKAIKKLVTNSWVFERKNPQDRRQTQLGMTPQGDQAMHEWLANVQGRKPGSFRITDIRVWTGNEDGRTTYTVTYDTETDVDE
jgi:DNA-binding MarR family transcriptional regulator